MSSALVPALAVFALLGVVLAVVDVRTRRLPDAILMPGGAAAVLSLCAAAIGVGEPWRLLGVAGGAIGAFVTCLALHLARPASFGGGDVKLAGLCGAFLGWCGPEAVASGIAAGVVVGGVAAAGAVLAGARGATIAFGPFLVLGTWWRLLTGPW
ncbi:prepilin peptidase [Microbacterium trichothecenolyticum]|uniref:Leader peptidase (Prepilin peptidase)/N-methyltransferase n=1 Tax=Microbacterium trichothecenolyticum TaxID=69370 RepID=A0ABU0TSB6_MICTR|nr:A24 family peptidase [Microbacterium trichothecenolyticum]MDQ1122551.1 leader peptidase (prepilin peptidase)/N-methyltransferase [Microbacterium trichothecenolyticum]